MKQNRRRVTNIIRTAAVLLFTCVSFTCYSLCLVGETLTNPDSSKVFSLSQLYDRVIKHHPVARQAELLHETAKQELRLARGNFDPKLEAQWQKKESNDALYYDILNGSLKFPSILPVDPVIGVDRNAGKYLNPERYISPDNNDTQVFAGLSVPLGRGLITDERRASLKQAELFGQLMQAEQIKQINKLLLEVAKDYWQWAYAYYSYRVYEQSVQIAADVYRRGKLNYELGEAAPIDTVQAAITLQQRRIERQEAWLEFQNATVQLSNHLWDSLANPLDLPQSYKPLLPNEVNDVTASKLEELLSFAETSHPDLQKLDTKLRQLEVEQRLAKEFLKPRLDFNYYFLNQPLNPSGEVSMFTVGHNYKWGLELSFPIFLRKERAKLAQTRVKISSTELQRSYSEREILNEVRSTYNELLNYQQMITFQKDMVKNCQRLLEAELMNLQNGESDLFKINVQQDKLLQNQVKLVKLLAQYQKQSAYLYWAAGVTRLGK